MYSNAFGMQMNNNELLINFGISEDVTKPDESVLEQTCIVLNLPSAKLLMNLLGAVLGRFEADTQTTIPVDAERLEAIAKSLNTRSTEGKR